MKTPNTTTRKQVLARLAATEETAAPMEISPAFVAAFQPNFRNMAYDRLSSDEDRREFERKTAPDQLEFILGVDLKREPVWRKLGADYARDCIPFLRLQMHDKIALFTKTFKPFR